MANQTALNPIQKPIKPLDTLARRTVLSLFERVAYGCLVVEEGDNTFEFGQPKAEAPIVATLRVNASWVYRRVLFHGSVGTGEAFMLAGWTSPDLVAVVRLMVRNQAMLQSMDRRWQFLTRGFHRLSQFLTRNNREGSKKNIAAHYDLGNDFFRLFLDKHMMYSSAVYPHANASLDEAAEYKLAHICQRLNLQPEDHLLEIGTGWGGFAVYAAKHFGCKVTTTTISQEQYALACQRVVDEGLTHKVTVLCQDYRELEGQFDKLVSIEMIEAVGQQYLPTFFERCSQLLKPNGVMLLQAITIADQRYDQASRSIDFIQRYIFPGGFLPCVSVIGEQMRRATDMQMVGLEDITLHYAKTLEDWGRGFMNKIEQVRKEGFDDIFERMWWFYLCYCQGGFAERVIGCVQVVMAKPEAQQLPTLGIWPTPSADPLDQTLIQVQPASDLSLQGQPVVVNSNVQDVMEAY